MLNFSFKNNGNDNNAKLQALDKSQAVIEFAMDGTILEANQNFLNAMGYTLEEIKGKHHSMFVDPAYKTSPEYQQFWAGLNRGEYQAAEYKRIGKDGKEIWIQASYNPILGSSGKPERVVKYATDITKQKIQNADYAAQIDAINKSQAVIQFNLDGTIIDANTNFLGTLGYSLDEIKGKHHAIFVDPAFRESAEYRQFWENLARGQYQAGEYKRFGKGGKEIWIQASYNPIFDLNGKVKKVVKYATDITKAKLDSMNAARLKLALDTCTANVMMADADCNIMYLNASVGNFLKEAEKDIQKDLPRFSTASLLGSNMDVFHKNPAHQRGMMERLSETYKTSIQLGGRSFNLVANPIFGPNKERLGTVVEWQDGAAAGMVDAINKSQAVIEFMPDGTIMNANPNFLAAMGYVLDEIKGKHHSMFADAAYKASAEYRIFWENLAKGEPQTGEFKRFGKGGKEIWIQASYNPILDLRGKVVRVVKTAVDITEMVTMRQENERGMNEAVNVLTGIAAGNLMQKMELEYKGTFSDIKKAVNSTVDRLVDTVTHIKESAESVMVAANEISSGSTDLSQRTEEQASSLEETAASMEEITGTVRQNTENANNANQLASGARDVAERGGKVVDEAVTAMGTIERSSQKISDIIGVIDEIAFL
ncbi:MAG: PAS domain S-box protein [Alphaproteobacteria bacterium]|nr:PAS domain S-box protein [Alphaproteobacteria bacterium]